ncbi:hypothetical protein [Massilia rhizosphaerae]|uniref:hypothetical protein n=1 Tax=Massilia rhizosphaerae TaxID=2784389 RepID=UPI0018DE8F62|nr:hypothetical protein [Massilia rhizosphaerae]
MSTESPALKRDLAAYIISAICWLSALMLLAAGLMVLNDAPAVPPLNTIAGITTAYVLLLWGVTCVVQVATGCAVFLMRTEALAGMGYLLTNSLSELFGRPNVPVTFFDALYYLALIYFTVRLFERSPRRRSPVQSDRRHLYRMLLLGLAANHLTVLIRYSYAYPELARSGALPPILVLAALVGCGAFYAAILTIRSHPERAKKLFLFAALFTALQLPEWGYRWSMATPFWLEVPIALFGFALARHWCKAGNPIPHP